MSENTPNTAPAPAILAAAARLFANKGYDATSTREIAEAAGVTKPTIYYYFHSKEGILNALLSSGISFLTDRLKASNAKGPGTPARECLEDAVWAFFEFAVEKRDLLRFIHDLSFGPANLPARKAVVAGFKEVEEEFRRVMARAVAQGVLAPEKAPQAAMALRGVTIVYCFEYFEGRVELPRRAAAEAVEGILGGYAKDSSVKKDSETA